MPQIGRLDQRITFQERSKTGDGIGGNTETWADIGSIPTVWANVFPGSGKEAMSSGEIAATSLTRFTIRNRSDIDEAMRLVWEGENYNIRAVRRTGSRSMYLAIDAERGVAS